MGTPASVWLGFLTLVIVILTFDLGVLNRKDHEIGIKESLWYSLGYITLACLFGVWVWSYRGGEDGMNFFTAYLVEQSLSLDNLFVMSMIFAYFGIPRIYQHRVLFWGIVGVIVMRGILIGFGTALVHQFEEILLIFAAFLIFTGFKMTFSKDGDEGGIEDSRLLKFLQKHMNVSPFMRGHQFFIREKGVMHGRHGWQATPLFLALVTIEFADLLFAVDSVPAVLSITNDTFVVYTSNIFAVLGLRTMYFAVAAVIHRFHYMKYALSIILIFIGVKAFYSYYVDKIPAVVSLGVTLSLLIGGLIYSMIKTRSDAENVVKQALEERKDAHKDAHKDALGRDPE
ncbi:MAG: TerC family protein [Micavibrio sp.]